MGKPVFVRPGVWQMPNGGPEIRQVNNITHADPWGGVETKTRLAITPTGNDSFYKLYSGPFYRQMRTELDAQAQYCRFVGTVAQYTALRLNKGRRAARGRTASELQPSPLRVAAHWLKYSHRRQR